MSGSPITIPSRVSATSSSPALAARIAKTDDLVIWVWERIDGLRLASLPNDLRTQIAGGCLHTVIEHHQAIRTLIHEGLNGSALALIRPTLEAFIRAAWVASVASDDEVERLRKDEFPAFGAMLKALETEGNVGEGRLMRLKKDHWGRLCSFTHTGAGQILGRLTPGGLGGDGFANEEIMDALTWADWLAIQTVRTLGRIAHRPNVVRSAENKVLEHFPPSVRDDTEQALS